LDQFFVIQDVLRREDSFSQAVAKILSLTNALKEDIQLGGFTLETKRCVAINYLLNLE
jgi:hypothetical protein